VDSNQDEAHNVIDAISSIYSVTVSNQDLLTVKLQLESYYNRYKRKFGGKTSMYVKQLLLAVTKFLEVQCTSSFQTVQEFLCSAGIEHINLFKIIEFLSSTRLALKVQYNLRSLLGFYQPHSKTNRI
jgi:chromosome transmission fidelity protein 1